MPRKKKIESGDHLSRPGKAGCEEVPQRVVIVPRPLRPDEQVDEGVTKRVVVVFRQGGPAGKPKNVLAVKAEAEDHSVLGCSLPPLRMTAFVPARTSKKVAEERSK